MPEIKCKQCGCALYPLDGVTVVQCSHCATVNTVEQNPDRAPFIFASYAHKDSAIVLPIIKAMKDDGFRIWHDNGVEVGTEWPAYIERMLRGCSVFIIFLSDHSVDSVNCRKEVNFAINNLGKKVLVMQMAEQIDYKEYGMEFQLDSYQKLFVCRHADLQSLLSALREANILQTCKDTAAKPVPTETAIPTATAQSDTDRVKALVKRAFLFLEDGEREKADAYCEQALDLDPEYAPAYVVKTMLALGYTDIRDFENKCTEKLATHPAFSKALRFADDLYRATLRHMEQQSNYNRALMLMQKGDMMSLCEAIVEFQSLEDTYADAADLRAQCQQKLDALNEEAKQRAEQENAEKPVQKKHKHRKKLFGRLAVCPEDVSATHNSAEQFNNPVVLPMPNKMKMKFEFIENSSWDNEYFIVSRDENCDAVVFYIFKQPSGKGNPPVFISTGKKIKKIYRAFMENHKDEYTFTDEAKMQPNIQVRKADKPRGFLESTASGMFGIYLGKVIEIPPKYTYIGEHVFKYANTSYAEKIVIPDTVQRIEEYAFYDIYAKVIVVPNSVTDIGLFAFCLTSDGYIECDEGSYAFKYAKDNKLRTSVDIINEYKQLGCCQHCGGAFKKKLFQGNICKNCGKPKDY